MGLDMYLSARRYVSGYDFSRERDGALFDALESLTGITPTPRCPSFNLETTVGYWRKANAIHAWFVLNVQDGNDDCKDYFVKHSSLQELRDTCQKILDARTNNSSDLFQLIEDKLPPQAGFFFGGIETDDHYFRTLAYTVELIDSLLDNPLYEGYEFVYGSSW